MVGGRCNEELDFDDGFKPGREADRAATMFVPQR